MPNNSYNLEALKIALERDNAILLNDYTKVTKRSVIYFKCNCGQEYNKKCLDIVTRAGAFCKKCTIKNQTKKLQKQLEQKTDLVCSKVNLDNIIKRDNALLVESYDVIIGNMTIKFKCKCGEESEKNCLQLIKVSGAFCTKCTRVNWTEKTKNTNLERYNVVCSALAPHVKEKIEENNIKKFGSKNPFASPEIQEKIKQTMNKKYNVSYISQLSENKQAMKNNNPMFIEENKNKLRQTLLERYNVEHYSQTPEFKEKFRQTCLEKYNVEHPSQTEEFREKVKESFIKQYGVDNPNKTPEIREKIKQTCLKRYNVEHPSQCKEIQEKTQKNAKKFKEYTMPSGEIRKVQGYESFALDELTKIYEESDIITNRKDIPRISYKIGDKQKYYFPDIYIKSENKIIEVKSTWTYKCKQDNIQEKEKATKESGYNYETWIYDGKGNKTKIEND